MSVLKSPCLILFFQYLFLPVCRCISVSASSLSPLDYLYISIHATMSTTIAQAPMPELPAAQLLNRSSHGWLDLCIPCSGWERENMGRDPERKKEIEKKEYIESSYGKGKGSAN